MKVSFFLYSRQPLGKMLDRILALSESAGGLVVRQTLLTSRQRRGDLSRNEVLRSAAASPSDSCEIVTDAGAIGVAWLYGERRNVPRMWGTLEASEERLDRLKMLLNQLCASAGVTYGVCDTEPVRMAAMGSVPDTYESNGLVTALQDIYWYNYFGREYRGLLSVNDRVRAVVSEVIEVDGAGMAVITRSSPEDAVDPQRVAGLATEWPVFRKHGGKGFREPIRIDYSQVWNLAAPAVREMPIRAIIGPADAFIAAAVSNGERFREWARAKGLPLQTEDDFRRIFQQYEAVIRDELLVPAIAAYGEMVRANMGGAWRKAEILHRGEPVIAKPGRPWTARRVILEVLEALEPIET